MKSNKSIKETTFNKIVWPKYISMYKYIQYIYIYINVKYQAYNKKYVFKACQILSNCPIRG